MLRHLAKRVFSVTKIITVTTKFNINQIAVIAQNECYHFGFLKSQIIMKIYCKTTKELFGFINFEKPTLFKFQKEEIKIRRVKYCYFFPQRVTCWSEKNKTQTIIYFLFWRIFIGHVKAR